MVVRLILTGVSLIPVWEMFTDRRSWDRPGRLPSVKSEDAIGVEDQIASNRSRCGRPGATAREFRRQPSREAARAEDVRD
jgi:hypothetical protein